MTRDYRSRSLSQSTYRRTGRSTIYTNPTGGGTSRYTGSSSGGSSSSGSSGSSSSGAQQIAKQQEVDKLKQASAITQLQSLRAQYAKAGNTESVKFIDNYINNLKTTDSYSKGKAVTEIQLKQSEAQSRAKQESVTQAKTRREEQLGGTQATTKTQPQDTRGSLKDRLEKARQAGKNGILPSASASTGATETQEPKESIREKKNKIRRSYYEFDKFIGGVLPGGSRYKNKEYTAKVQAEKQANKELERQAIIRQDQEARFSDLILKQQASKEQKAKQKLLDQDVKDLTQNPIETQEQADKINAQIKAKQEQYEAEINTRLTTIQPEIQEIATEQKFYSDVKKKQPEGNVGNPFSKPFLSVEGQKQRLGNVKEVLKIAVNPLSKKRIYSNTGSDFGDRALESVANNPYKTAGAIAVGYGLGGKFVAKSIIAPGVGGYVATKTGLKASELTASAEKKEVIRSKDFKEAYNYATTYEKQDEKWYDITNIPNALGVVRTLNPFGTRTERFEEGARYYYKNKGLTGEELETAVIAQKRQRRVGAISADVGIIGGNVGSEIIGQKLVSSSFKKVVVNTKAWYQPFTTTFAKTSMPIAKAGLLEGSAIYGATTARDYRKLDVGEYTQTLAIAGASAGIAGGVIASATGKIGKGLLLGAYISDPFEKAGDVIANKYIKTSARKAGRRLLVPAIVTTSSNSVTLTNVEDAPGKATLPKPKNYGLSFTTTQANTRTDTNADNSKGLRIKKNKMTYSFTSSNTKSNVKTNTKTSTRTNTKTNANVNTRTNTNVRVNTKINVKTPVNVPTNTLVNTPINVYTPVNAPVSTPVNVPVTINTPVNTPVSVPVNVVAPYPWNVIPFIPLGGGDGTIRGRGGSRRSRRTTKYTASFEAVVGNIKAKKGFKKKELYSGQEFRPILIESNGKKKKKKNKNPFAIKF